MVVARGLYLARHLFTLCRRELVEEEEHGGKKGQGSDQSFASDDGLLLTWEEEDLE